jgi:hypothetical protein
MRPYRFKGVREYRDELGWYTLVGMKDVWEIPMVGRTSKERTGYASQKPVALLERIVSACTDEGDLCIDLFGGSGTLAAAARRTGRRWITADNSPLAAAIAEKRLSQIPGKAFVLLKERQTDEGSSDSAPDIKINAFGAAETEAMLAGPGLSLLIESYAPGKTTCAGLSETEREHVAAAAAFDPSQFIALADVVDRAGGAKLRLVDIFGGEVVLPLT